MWAYLQVRSDGAGVPLPLQARRRDGVAPPGAAGVLRDRRPQGDEEAEGPGRGRAHPQGASAPNEAERSHANDLGPRGALQRRGGGQGGDAALPDAEPQVQGRREGGPDNIGRVQDGPAHGGQVYGNHAEGQGVENTL